MFTTVALLALGVFALVNLVKAALPFKTLPPAKLLVTLLLAILAVLPFAQDWRERLLMGVGVYGLATLLHGLHKLLQAAGDDRRVAMIQRGIRR